MYWVTPMLMIFSPGGYGRVNSVDQPYIMEDVQK